MRIQHFFDFVTMAFVALLGAFYIWISAKIGGGDKEKFFKYEASFGRAEYRFHSRLHSAKGSDGKNG